MTEPSRKRELAVRQWLERATGVHRSGDLAAAETLYHQVLRAQPEHFEALHLFGVLRAQQGRLAEALELVSAALRVKPGSASAHTNHGLILHRMQRDAEALSSFASALAIEPDHAQALNNRGNALAALARYAEALASYEQAIAIKPDYAEAFSNRGHVLLELGDRRRALASYERALRLRSDDVQALCGRARILADEGAHAQALASYDQALALWPGDADAFYDRGNILAKLKRYDDALTSYARALALNPTDAKIHAIHENRGNALSMLRRHREALASYDAALALDPASARALTNRATTLKELKRHDEALAGYAAALALAPRYAPALYGRANTLKEIKRYGEALDAYDQARSLQPEDADAYGWVDAALATCDWARTAGLAEGIARGIAVGRSVVTPFTLLGFCDDPALHLQCARNYLEDRIPFRPKPLASGPHPNPPRHSASKDARERAYAGEGMGGGGKLRIAYLSSDFREHATAYLSARLFELHDRSRFEILGISFGRHDGSSTHERLTQAFDRLHDVEGRNDREIAMLIRDLAVDIAVDLNGFTRDARPEVLSFRPAPIQVGFLAFPGTTAADFIDYIIADKVVLPPDQHRFYTEKFVYLPDCYQPNDDTRPIAHQACTRGEAKLPETGFVFCCFNNNYKITQEIFEVWMRLLAAVPGSVLWLLRDNAGAQANLRREAKARGVDPERLVFADRVGQAEHLARHRHAGLFLDTLPYNAHTTGSDALWAGVPVVTCRGRAFAGRVAASLLQAVGVPELVTQDLAEYEALALRLATDAAKLEAIASKLKQNRHTQPLFDSGRFCRHIEAAYARMWDIYRHGGSPRSFGVEADDRPLPAAVVDEGSEPGA